MKNMVGSFWKGFWKGKDGCIDLFIEGKGVHRTNGFYGEPVAAKGDLFKMVELSHSVHIYLSNFVNCTECKCSCGARMAMLGKYVP